MWRRCCCCKKTEKKTDLSERSSHPFEQELQGVIKDLQTAHTALEAEKAKTAGLVHQKAEAEAEHPIYQATARELLTRIENLKGQRLALADLQDSNESLRLQIAALLEQRSQEKNQLEGRNKHLEELQENALSLHSQCETLIGKKRQAEKDSERAKSRLEAAQITLVKLKTRESEIARQTAKVTESSRSQARRSRLLTLHLIWSRLLLNRQARALHRWDWATAH